MTDRDRLVPDEGLTPASEALPGAAGPLKIDKPPRSQWADVWDQFKHHKGAMAGGIITPAAGGSSLPGGRMAGQLPSNVEPFNKAAPRRPARL